MRKITIKKTDSSRSDALKSVTSTWTTPIYVYWFIILFFIAATFYILGRSHGMIHNPATLNEEILMQASDYFNSGQEKLKSGDVEGAIVDLTAVVNSGAVSGTAYLARGEAYMLMGDYKKAMSDFNSAIEHDSTNVLAFYDKALLEMRLEDYDAAMVDINNALVVAATNPAPTVTMRDLYAKRGQLNLWQKNWDGAIADYTNSLARPDGTVTPNVYAERAEAYTARGDYADAITDYASAMQIIKEQLGAVTDTATREKLPHDVMTYKEKTAALYLKLENKQDALNNLRDAYQIAIALNDTDNIDNLAKLISDLENTNIENHVSENTAPAEEPGQVFTLDQVQIAVPEQESAPVPEVAPESVPEQTSDNSVEQTTAPVEPEQPIDTTSVQV